MQRLFPRFVVASLALAISASAATAQETSVSIADPLDRPAEVMPLADRAMLLDITRSGERFIAVGERGHVLVSSNGTEWTQSANVPLRSALTAVTAVGNDVWAVGHDGAILHSADAGENWEIQRRDPRGQPGEGIEDDLRQGSPLLDVIFTDANHGMAIGAYSLLVATSDGGKTWAGSRINVAGNSQATTTVTDAEFDGDIGADVEPAHDDNAMESSVFTASELKIGQEDDPHLNGVARTGSGDFVIVGERGAVFTSRDGGINWERSQLPYDGSMFGIVGYEGQRVIAFGLRGHVFESNDLGATWVVVPTDSELSLMGGTPLANGGVVIVGANGIVLHRAGDAEPLKKATHTAAGVIAGALPIGADNELLIVSENGISRFQPK